jgi:hypothetical protein
VLVACCYTFLYCAASGSYSSEYGHDLQDLGPRSAVKTDRRFSGAYYLSWQMMVAIRSSETSVNFYQTTRRNNP